MGCGASASKITNRIQPEPSNEVKTLPRDITPGKAHAPGRAPKIVRKMSMAAVPTDEVSSAVQEVLSQQLTKGGALHLISKSSSSMELWNMDDVEREIFLNGMQALISTQRHHATSFPAKQLVEALKGEFFYLNGFV